MNIKIIVNTVHGTDSEKTKATELAKELDKLCKERI